MVPGAIHASATSAMQPRGKVVFKSFSVQLQQYIAFLRHHRDSATDAGAATNCHAGMQQLVDTAPIVSMLQFNFAAIARKK